MKQLKYLLMPCLIFAMASCKENNVSPEDKPENETELITTLQLILTDSASGQKDTFSFRDPDGEGGNAPVQFDSIRLTKNSVYNCHIVLLDESKTPADTISNAVKEEADEHLFVFKASDLDLSISIGDKDSKGLPLGLDSKWRSKNTGAGKLTVILKHQPGVKDGTEAPGETDVEVSFPCLIE